MRVGDKGAVSLISDSEAIDGPRMWKRTKLNSPAFAASRKPTSRSAARLEASAPARVSMRRDFHLRGVKRIEDTHLVRRLIDIDDLRDLGMKALQASRAASRYRRRGR